MARYPDMPMTWSTPSASMMGYYDTFYDYHEVSEITDCGKLAA